MQLITVFDTNAYIGLTARDVDHLVRLEAEAGVVAMVSAWPCLELLARSAEADSRTARRAWAAVRKAVIHAGYGTPHELRLHVHEAGEVTLARGMFGKVPDEPLLEIGFVADLMVEAASDSLGNLRRSHLTELDAIAERVRAEEERFVAMVNKVISASQGLKGTPIPPEREAIPIHAAALVIALAEKYQVPLEAVDVTRCVERLVYDFGVAMHFMHGIMIEARTSGTLPGKANSAWDLKMAFHAGRGASVLGVPVQVVSGDGRLHGAARAAGEDLRVISPSKYRTLLSDPTSVALHCQRLRRGGTDT